MEIKVMSYNTQHCLNYVTQEIDYDIIADTIKNCGADIIGLQEMRNESEADGYDHQAKILAEKLGFSYYYFAEAIRFEGVNPYGNALISRYPLKSVETVIIPDPDPRGYDGYYETRCLLKATIDVGGELCVIVSHFGLNPDEHESAVKTVLANAEKNACVVMGDFNMHPDDPILRPIEESLYDTAEKFPEEKLSYPSDDPIEKIDYIFTTPDLKVIDADIPAIVSSDHRPHLATIEM